MTQVQKILNYLWSIAPQGATNAQIAQGTGITPHQAVYMATQALLYQGRVHSERQGRQWVFLPSKARLSISATRPALRPALPAITTRR